MKTEKLVESVQAVVFLFAFGGYGYSLYHFLSFYTQNNDLNWVSARVIRLFIYVAVGINRCFACLCWESRHHLPNRDFHHRPNAVQTLKTKPLK